MHGRILVILGCILTVLTVTGSAYAAESWIMWYRGGVGVNEEDSKVTWQPSRWEPEDTYTSKAECRLTLDRLKQDSVTKHGGVVMTRTETRLAVFERKSDTSRGIVMERACWPVGVNPR